MTAYGAVNSLKNTIYYILYSSHFSLVDSSPRILLLAFNELNPLQKILEGLDRTRTSKSRKKVNGLDGRIKELIWEFQHLLESLLYKQILSQFHEVYEEMKDRVWGEPPEEQAITVSDWSSMAVEVGLLDIAWQVGSLASGLSQPKFLSKVGLRESDSRFSIDLHCLDVKL